MTGKEAFEIWAPSNTKWTDWVRPVLFVSLNQHVKEKSIIKFSVPPLFYIDKLQENIAIFVDLPEHTGIEEGVALAHLGFRPIPLYNGTIGQKNAMSLVDNQSIEEALLWGASELKKLAISANASPVFLLDSNRTHRFKMNVSIFDNSWDLYSQDTPSAEYFLNNGINKIIIHGVKVQKDLSKILIKFQKKGISIFYTNGYEEPKKITIKKPLFEKR